MILCDPVSEQKNERLVSHFTSNAYLLFVSLLAMGGMAASVYLSISHYRNFSDIGYQSFCAISRSLNCDTVSQSPYAIFLNVPVAVWGSIGYVFFLAFLMLFKTRRKNHGWAILCVSAGLFSLISIAMALVSSFYVRSYCLMCIVSYAINFMLLLLTWMAQRRFGSGSFVSTLKVDVAFLNGKRVHAFLIVFTFIILSMMAIFFYPKYWLFPSLPKGGNISSGITDDGNPWIGAQHPSLTITEFTDYMCFQCGKMHSQLRRLVGAYPNRIRLVHRHFPLDRMVNPVLKDTIHQNSGLLSILAIFAQDKGKFWQINDLLFRDAREKMKINLGSIGKESGLDVTDFKKRINDRRLIDKLEADIRMGLRLGVSATPSYEIDGKLYTGTIPEDVLAPLLKEN